MARYRLNPLSMRETSSTALPVASATVTVYKAGGVELATCYANTTTETALTGSQTTTNSSGYFEFFVDSADYANTQKFKVVISKTGYADATYDYLNIFPDLSGVRDRYVEATAFLPPGFVIDGSVDYTTYLQNAIDECLTDPRRPKKLVLPAGKFLITDDLVVTVKTTAVNVNWGQFIIEGQGGGSYTDGSVGTTLYCTTSGKSIIRICEESSGAYPGGGAGVVTTPLQYLRRVHISGINFIGDASNPTYVNGIVGRGINSSVVEYCGFYALNYGIRFGKAGATSQETSADGYELDYCEQNTIRRNTFKKVDNHLNIMAGDITTIEGNFFSTTANASGIILRLVGGQDFYDIRSNIFHPYVNGTTTPLTKAVHIIGVRGYKFTHNHFEGLTGNLLTADTQSSEYGIFENNLIYGATQSSTYIFNLYLASTHQFILRDNNIAMPNPSASFINWAGSGGATGKDISIDFSNNQVTTTLGGSTTYDLTVNSAVYRSVEEGSWTPVLSANVAGDLSVTYSTQTGTWKKIGRRVYVAFSIVTSAFTHTTASGFISITGLPYPCGSLEVSGYGAMSEWSGVTKANYTQIGVLAISGNSSLNLRASGSAQTVAYVDITDCPTGGTVRLIGTIEYDVDTK